MNFWHHQTECIQRAEPLDYFGLFFEPGCGKTATTIKILEDKFTKERTILKTLIICPLIVVEQWASEIAKFSSIPNVRVMTLTGSGTQRLSDFQNKNFDNLIVITNYEALYSEKLYMELCKWKPEALVIDESQRIKSHNSKRTKCIVNIARLAKYRYILSGTPVLNSPLDLFSQMLALDHGKRLGTNYYRFLYNYFFDLNTHKKRDAGYFPLWKPRPDTNENLNRIISDCTMRVRKEEVLDLPPFIKKDIHVELSNEQRKLYNELKRDFVAYIDDKACVAELAITKALRLQQIASGFCVFDDDTIKEFDKTPRVSALIELLEEITPAHKVIVWAVFKNNYKQIRKACQEVGVSFAELHGEEKDKLGNIEKFKTDPKCRVLIGHPGSGGIGVNLTNASYSIFYSRNFSLEFDIQAEARNYRGGSLEAGHKNITRIDLVAKDTIDDTISKAIQFKKVQSEKIVDGFGFSNNDLLDLFKEELRNGARS